MSQPGQEMYRRADEVSVDSKLRSHTAVEVRGRAQVRGVLRPEWEALASAPGTRSLPGSLRGPLRVGPGAAAARGVARPQVPQRASDARRPVAPEDQPAPRRPPGAPSPRTPHLTPGGSRPASSAGPAPWPRREPGGGRPGRPAAAAGPATRSARESSPPPPRRGCFRGLAGRGHPRPRPAQVSAPRRVPAHPSARGTGMYRMGVGGEVGLAM